MRGEAALLTVKPRRATIGNVAAWLPSRQQQARLMDALKSVASISFATSGDDLLRYLRTTLTAVSVVVIPSTDADGASTEMLIKRVAIERPRAAIAVWCPLIFQSGADLRALTAAGAHQFILGGGHDSGVLLRNAIEKARQTSAAEQVMASLRAMLPALLHPIAEAILEHPATVTTIRELADALMVHRKTLFNRCERAGDLSPTELLGWVRLCLVAYHLDNTGCTVETLAMELGYPSSATLRNTIKRYTRLRASDLRDRGALMTAMHALETRLL